MKKRRFNEDGMYVTMDREEVALIHEVRVVITDELGEKVCRGMK